ncbi:DUF438 domain-containing protein [Jeotgalibaca ciconiae]|uniref:DUF438 domain-containing protein n=1 Tax=Jeotgalibaca ciconiae TaxID=2496265 RepID=A0A3S9H9J9_9LACT|nr:DUF438 domain-containing protein [Jeotgalibaca ciconiae]AZP03971.1 DUF438 domain-containing protein [Jeotgalibaca ciconiae]HJB23293.1 DUF438 domain-containing protein [Candidatus Jeotgalibaca pullicola]
MKKQSQRSIDFEARQMILKDLILRLHDGEDEEQIKIEFKEHFDNVSAFEISVMERRLMSQGIQAEEIMLLCNVHASLFNGSIESVYEYSEEQDKPGHPIRVIKEENLAIETALDRIEKLFFVYLDEPAPDLKHGLLLQIDMLWEIDKHYARKENSFFPIMERYGFTAPPKVMWGVDDQIRDMIKSFRNIIETDQLDQATEIFDNMKYEIEEMVVKEEEIMLPMIIPFFNEDDWISIAAESEEIGYCMVQPEAKWKPERYEFNVNGVPTDKDGNIQFETGYLSVKELEKILNEQPLELTFVDANDKVKYFNNGPGKKLFPRTKNSLGREVYNCHPPKSQPIVRKLIADFKAGTKDSETLWFRARGNFVMVTYKALRDDDGSYLGTYEYVQDIENIVNIDDERRSIE